MLAQSRKGCLMSFEANFCILASVKFEIIKLFEHNL